MYRLLLFTTLMMAMCTRYAHAQTKKIQAFSFAQGIIANDTSWEYLDSTRIYNRNGYTMPDPAKLMLTGPISEGRASEYEGYLLDYVNLYIKETPALLFSLDSLWLYNKFIGKDYGYINKFSPGRVQTFGGDYDFSTQTVDKKEHIDFVLNAEGKTTLRTVSDVDYDLYPISYDIIPRFDYTYTYDNLGHITQMVSRKWDINNPLAPPQYYEKETWAYNNDQLLAHKKFSYENQNSWFQLEEINYVYIAGKLSKTTLTRHNNYQEEFSYQYNLNDQVSKVIKQKAYPGSPLTFDSYKQYSYSGNNVAEEIDATMHWFRVYQNEYVNNLLMQTTRKEVNLTTNDTLNIWQITIERDQDSDIVCMIHNNFDNQPPYTNTDYRTKIYYAFVTDTTPPNNIKKVITPLQVTIYPNPASDYLTLSSDKDLRHAQVSISSIEGRLIKRFVNLHQNRIDIADLPAGSYILTVNLKNYSGTVKFIKG